MRSSVIVCLLVGLALAPAPAPAQDVEALRKELEQMRQQFEAMRDQYQQAIEKLSERIKGLESRPGPLAAPPAPGPAPVVSQTPPGLVSPMELARPREPFALYQQRGPGQLLYDMGVVADFVGNLTQRNVQKADGGTFAGRENRFFPREVEVNLFGRIDPYAEGLVRFEFGEDFEDGRRSLNVALAEAYLRLLTLPSGTQLSLGRVPVRFGVLSHLHREALPQPDSPQVLLRFLGEEQLRENGAELSWVAPLPFFVELVGGLFNGDNETAFGRGSLKYPLVTGRVRTFFELGESGAIQLGASIANGQTPEQRNNQLLGFDAKYKYKPEGWQHALLTLAGEYLYGIRQVTVVDPGVGVRQTRTRERDGWYVYGELQPFRFGPLSRWLAGFRYDRTEYPVNPGHEWAVEPYLAFMPSDFLRFRLASKHTERSSRDGINLIGGSARTVDEVLFQATFFLGAHPAHPF